MTLIDQRILIDAPVENVWKMLTDPRELRGWHADYVSVSILTTNETGVGVRRRCGLASVGKDIIEEITAWVDGLGYEYTVVEGGPYRSMSGRFRLQGSPDGTSIQWVINYEPKGIMGMLRDRLGGRKRMAEMMTASLRELRRRVDALGVRMDDDYRARVGIRARLDASERADYQRRYSAADDDHPAEADSSAPSAAPPPAAPVPSFVADLTGPESDYSATADTKPRKPKGLQRAIDAQQADQEAPVIPAASPASEPTTGSPLPYSGAEAEFARPAAEDDESAPTPEQIARAEQPTTAVPTVPDAPEPADAPATPPEPAVKPAEPVDAAPAPVEAVPDHQKITPPRGIKLPTPPEAQTPEARPTEAPPARPAPSDEPPTQPRPPASPAPAAREPQPPPTEPGAAELPPQTPMHDTGEISIWDAFGMRRPSEADAAALDQIVRFANARQRARRRVPGKMRGALKRPVRARSARSRVMGLRLYLALQRANVRQAWNSDQSQDA